MEIVDSGKDKVKKICETLKKQTLDPAKQEARNIIDHALKEAEKITGRDINKDLKLPEIKVHCSLLGSEALKQAIKNYKSKKS